MTREKLDTLWQKAHDEAIPDPLTCAPVVIYHFASLVAASEREACAEIAGKELRNTAMLTSNPPKSAAAWDIRNAIRARGNV